MRYNTSTNYFVLQVMRKKNSQLNCIVVDFFFFFGVGRIYLDEKMDWFDHCDIGGKRTYLKK
jgi:hypothetical protein